jgi:DNA gyrase inhibitor GyrI
MNDRCILKWGHPGNTSNTTDNILSSPPDETCRHTQRYNSGIALQSDD